jgi:signal peptidase I
MQPTPLLAAAALGPARAAPSRVRAPRRAPRPRRLLIALLLAAVCGGLGYLREWPPTATVMSGSMAPTIDTGDMVVLRKLGRPAAIGDIVVVNVPDEARSRYGYPPVVIHRVLRIGAGGAVTTKGDARKEPDPFTVPRSSLSARVVAKLPAAGNVLAFFKSPLGLLWLALGGVLFFAVPGLDRRRASVQREADGLRVQLEQITEELVELRYEQLAERDAIARQLAAMASAITALPGQIAAAAPAPAPDPEPEPEPEGDPLEQLELALVPAPRHPAAADESEPQLAFLLDVERRPRFARPSEDQLELALEPSLPPPAQLSLTALAPRSVAPPPPPPPPGAPKPPTWDGRHVVRVRRRSGGLVGLALGLVAQAAGT